MLTCWDNAFLATPPRILGRRLVPLTIGHLCLLWAARSPFVYAPANEPDFGDALTLLYVCSFPWRKAARRLLNPDKVACECRRWGRRAGKEDEYFTLCAVRGLVRESFTLPVRPVDVDSRPTESGVPWPWAVAARLARVFGRDGALDMNTQEAFAWSCSFLGAEGVTYQTDEQRELIEGAGAVPHG